MVKKKKMKIVFQHCQPKQRNEDKISLDLINFLDFPIRYCVCVCVCGADG